MRLAKVLFLILLAGGLLGSARAQSGAERFGQAIQGLFQRGTDATRSNARQQLEPPRQTSRDAAGRQRQAEQLYRTGRRFVEQGYYGEALDALNQSLALRPGFAPALTYKGIALRLMRQPQLALEQFNEAIAASPNDGIAHGERGLTQLMLGDAAKGNEDLKRSAQLQPDLARWYAYHSSHIAPMSQPTQGAPDHEYQPQPLPTPATPQAQADAEKGDQPLSSKPTSRPLIEWTSIWSIVKPALALAFALLAIAVMLRIAFGIFGSLFRGVRKQPAPSTQSALPSPYVGDSATQHDPFAPPQSEFVPAQPVPATQFPMPSPAATRVRPFLRRHRVFFYVGAACVVAALVLTLPAVLQAFRLDPEKLIAPRARPTVLDYRGNIYTQIGAPDKPVTWDDLPVHLVDALRAREDSRFFEHHGVDWYGLARAIVEDVRHMRIKQGASTLTMQLVEKAYDLDQKGLWNRVRSKLVEWSIARRAEAYLAEKLGSQRAAKQAIMVAYLNRVEFGDGTVGVGAASMYYFEKPVSKLTLGESCMLVALLRAPYANSPYRKPENSRMARDSIIAQMLRRGYISEEQAKQARFHVVSNPKKPRPQHNGYLVAAITREINALKASGKLPADVWDHDSLAVQSTLDLWAQELLDSEVRKVCSSFRGDTEEDPLGGAAILVDNATGQVRALVSGQDYSRSQYDLAMQSHRQIASVAKPFVYAAYVERGGNISEKFSNDRLQKPEVDALNRWNPDNASSLQTGEHPLSTGLAFSDNYITLRVGLRVGLPVVYDTLYAAGLISDKATTGPTWLLGTFECSLADAVSAYTAFPRRGTRAIPYLVQTVSIDGKEVYRAQPRDVALFAPRTCEQLHSGLREAITDGTGRTAVRNAGLDASLAGKTGTSQSAADVWWIGYVKEVTLGVRFGRNSNVSLGEAAAGGTMAAPVAARVLKKLSQRYALSDPFATRQVAQSRNN